MIELLLFLVGLAVLAWLGVIGLLVAMFALTVVLELVTTVFTEAVKTASWFKQRISRCLQRPVPPPCF